MYAMIMLSHSQTCETLLHGFAPAPFIATHLIILQLCPALNRLFNATCDYSSALHSFALAL